MSHHISSTEEAATEGAGSLTATDGLAFSFSEPMRKLIITNMGSTDLVVHLRSDTCNPTGSEWSTVVAANGGVFTFTDEKDPVEELACYSSGALTYGAVSGGYAIKGTPWWE